MNTNLVYVFLTSNFNQKVLPPSNVWSSTTLPSYCFDTFKFNSGKFTTSYVIAEKKEILQYKNSFPENTKFITVEDNISNTEEFKEAQAIIDTLWPRRYMMDTFWYTTFIRVLVLAIFVKKYKLENVIHIEADNLIFSKDIEKVFSILSDGEFAFCNEAPHASAPSIIAFKDGEAGSNLLKQHITLLRKGENTLNPYVGHFRNYITDMAFLDIIYRNKKNYKMLPCLPFGNQSENFETLQTVFDPTSYGQYLGGTNNGHEKGFIDHRHYVGQELASKNINVVFEDNAPYLYLKNKVRIPIFNLHVHNKKSIPLFLS